MGKIIKYLWTIFLVLVCIILWRNEYLLPIATTLASFFVVSEYLFRIRNLKDGRYLAVMNEKKNIFPSILWILPGILLIMFGFLAKNTGFSFRGINSSVFIGTYLFILGLIRFLSRKVIVILSDKYIITEGDFGIEEYSYKKLEKVVLRENKILIKKKTETLSFPLVNMDSEEINKIFSFLSLKLENRIIKE